MDKVIQELQRLYFLPNQQCRSGSPLEGPLSSELVTKSLGGEVAIALKLVSADNQVRSLVINFAKGGDWSRLAELYQRLQSELGMPALAVSVSAEGGFQLWFSLAECIPLPQAQAFLSGLRRKYLGDLPQSSVTVSPGINDAGIEQLFANLAPAFHEATDRWSAFIDPSLGSMFIEGPGLEIAPNLEAQADILAGFESIKAEDFQRALDILQMPDPRPLPGVAQPSEPTQATNPSLDIGTDYKDPRSFLLAVMNSSSASLDQRIKAATALLPHYESTVSR